VPLAGTLLGPSASEGLIVAVPGLVVNGMADAVAASPRLLSLDRALLILWVASAGLTLVWMLAGYWSLRRELASLARTTIDGTPVRIAERLGPAVLHGGGIVLPAWVLASDAASRGLMIRHEREHLRAGDATLLLIGALTVALMPWNPALWWLVRRLRDAVELDCDRRLIEDGVEPDGYGAMLIDVAGRGAGRRLSTAAALLEHASLLRRRIHDMTRSHRQSRRYALFSAGCALAGAVLFAVACAVPAPPREGPAPAAAAPTAPVRLRMDAPVYPPLLREAGIEGSVLLEFDVRPDGTVVAASVRVVERTHRAFERPAVDAIKTARYRAREGESAVRTTQRINFRLGAR
jgi:TonB family protein